MTNQELNRDVKRMLSKMKKRNILDKDLKDLETWFSFIEHEIRPEFKRLYFADQKFEIMNKSSILIMFRLNLKYRFIPFHAFGLEIEL